MPRGRAQRGNKPFKTRARGSSNMNTGSPTAAKNAMLQQPRMKPVVHFSRTITQTFDIVTDGINPTLGAYAFTLNQLPSPTDFTNLFQNYKLDKIKITFKPEYTELTDAALVSNAQNVNFNSVIDQNNPNPPISVQEVTQFQSNKATGITKQHTRSFKPTMLTSSQMPCVCYISTQNPSERHYGFKYAIEPTGVAMTFRSTATFWFTCAGAK